MPHTSSNLLIISAIRASRPRYWTRSVVALCKDHTIPSHNVASVWLCITLLTSKAYCSSETSLFWVGFSLIVLNFGILPTTCEATLGQEISCCGSDISLSDHLLVPSTDIFSSLPNWCNPSATIICSSIAMSHPVCTLWPNQWWIAMFDIAFQYYHLLQRLTKFLSSSLWMTIGSTVVCSHTSTTTISEFVNAGDNGCLLRNSSIDYSSLLLSPIGIGHMLSDNDVDIAQLQNSNYRYTSAIYFTIISLKVTPPMPIQIPHGLMASTAQ